MSDHKAPGTVVQYIPRDERFDPHWCREGVAIAEADGRLRDTYWGTRSQDDHFVTAAEMDSVEVLFQINDYDELDPYSYASAEIWATYHPDDRRLVTSQHGLQKRWFIRKGAQPDHGTKVANAQERVRAAEEKFRSAELNLQWRRDELAALLGSLD